MLLGDVGSGLGIRKGGPGAFLPLLGRRMLTLIKSVLLPPPKLASVSRGTSVLIKTHI